MQLMYASINGEMKSLMLPGVEEEVVPGVQWGNFDELLTPAFWKSQAWQHENVGNYQREQYSLGNSLVEEVAACLLGGYGMKAELGLLAFERLREYELLTGQSTISELEDALSEPFRVLNGSRRYRFPRQKARYLALCLQGLGEFEEPKNDRALRDELLRLPGIGTKTASWIVRNYRASNEVAIIDVHILRAGRHIGLFPGTLNSQRHYGILEDLFLTFSKAIGTAASMLDSLIWDYMRNLPIVYPQKDKKGRAKFGDNRFTADASYQT